MWDWFTPRLPEIFAKLTLDTNTIWESFVNVSVIHASEVLAAVSQSSPSQTTCSDRDPRRVQPIVDFILGLKIDFQSESVFPCEEAGLTHSLANDPDSHC